MIETIGINTLNEGEIAVGIYIGSYLSTVAIRDCKGASNILKFGVGQHELRNFIFIMKSDGPLQNTNELDIFFGFDVFVESQSEEGILIQDLKFLFTYSSGSIEDSYTKMRIK
jgi:hypothetical protein